TPDRFGRLYRLLQFLGTGPKSRERLIGYLQLDVRGFYRDLELLRGAGIRIALEAGAYGLESDLEDALALLPFPDPHLTVGGVRQLVRGRTRAHRYLQERLDSFRS